MQNPKSVVSKLVAGTMNWGQWGAKMNTLQMADMIQTCVDNQITTFDHADIYGAHTTEADFGKAFKTTSLSRNAIQLITKCGIKYPAENRNYKLKHYDYSVEHILFSVENSLKKLKTDFIDVLLLHRPSPLLKPEVVAEAFQLLKKQGKVLHFGVSNFSTSQMDLIRSEVPLVFNQIQFSVSEFEAMTNGLLNYMHLHNIVPMAWNPLGRVFREDTQHTQRLKNQLDILSEKYHTTPDVLLYAWILKHPSGILPIIGTSNPDRIKNSTKALDLVLEDEDWFSLWQASMGNKVP